MTKVSILTIGFLAAMATASQVEASVCITDFRPSAGGGFTPASGDGFDPRALHFGGWDGQGGRYYAASLSCQDLDAWKMGLKAASYSFNVIGLGLVCTPVGLPVSVGMFGAGFILYSADLVVDSLPCEDTSKAAQERVLKREICEALNRQGIQCDPEQMVRR